MARLTRHPLERLIGWIARPVPADVALGIAPCDQVHTFGVRVPLDCAWCARDGRALHVQTLAPNRVGPRIPGAWVVWEMRAGELSPFVAPGDRLELVAPAEP